jgi:putative tributyrin esterase
MRRGRVAVFLLSLLLPLSVYAQRHSAADTIQLQSKLVGAILPYKVILPTDYDRSRTTRYPVLYLLHGLSGHYSDWTTRTNVADQAARYRMIIVTPEGNDGWYADSVNVNTDRYESYILQELIPDVDKRYRTIQSRYGRAIAGLSMGGYGAFRFGLKFPDRFVFAGSMSGAFGVTQYAEKETPAGTVWESVLRTFGPPGSAARKANDLFEMIRELPASRVASLPYFYFDCGTEDSPHIFNSNRELDALMLQKKIPHEYRELPGDHSWAYWDQQIPEVLRIAAQKMRMPPAAPPSARRKGYR